MKHSIAFKALILSSVFSTAVCYSALSLGEGDFKDAGLEYEFNEASKSVRAKLIADDLDAALKAAKTIDQITHGEKFTTSKNYLEQVLKVLKAEFDGHSEDQDGEALTGFGNQIDKLLGFLQSAVKIQQMLDKPGNSLKIEDVRHLQSTLQFIGGNIESFLSSRKEMARVFWVRRVGHNPSHKDAFEGAWDALLRYKKIDLIVETLEGLSQDSQMRDVFGITPTTKPEEFQLSMSLLQNLPAHLLMGIAEFSDELFDPEEIQSLTQKYPNLKNILHFRTANKTFTSKEIELLKKMYLMLKEVPEFVGKKFTFSQILDLRKKYAIPYQVYWAGDNEDFSKPDAKIEEGAIGPLKDLGMETEADQILERVTMLQGRRMYLNEILIRALGRLEPENTVKMNKTLSEIRYAARDLKDKWAQHVLGRALNEGEELPKQEEFAAFLNHLHVQASQHFVFENGELDKNSIQWLGESVQVRLAAILGSYQQTYRQAVAGNEEAFVTVCAWADAIDEKKTEFFSAGDKAFFDEYDGETASKEDKDRFEKILTNIWTILGQKELKDHPEYVVWKLATEERSFQQIQDSLLLRIQGYEQQLEKDWFLSGNPEIKALPIPLLLKDHKNAEVWESASYSDGRKILAFGAALEAIDRYGLQLTTYSFMGEIIDLLKEAKTKRAQFAHMLTSRHDILAQLKTLVKNKDNILGNLGARPHWVRTFNLFETIWSLVPEERQKATQDIYKHGAVLQTLQLEAAQEKRQLAEEEYNVRVDKIIAAHTALKSPLSFSPLIEAQMLEAAKGLSTYQMTKDLRYTKALARLWWERRPAAQAFQQGEKRYDDILMFKQFWDALTKGNLSSSIRKENLTALWSAEEHKNSIMDYNVGQ